MLFLIDKTRRQGRGKKFADAKKKKKRNEREKHGEHDKVKFVTWDGRKFRAATMGMGAERQNTMIGSLDSLPSTNVLA